ncbi:hypothetical protein BJY04DRAFT_217871 [Aspergillus karnatakaensis]|uniref:uncharacterized protein n=1 Tax=Aspergillus karnatakaensis TaxID=1810916 RepID=UPI003CCCE514
MAEPLAILALGIEASKAIMTYCDGWRSCEDEIDSVKIKAEGLLSTLQIIDKLLRESTAIHPKIAADIAEKILQNEIWIRKVDEKVTKCWVVQQPAAGLNQKLRVTAKKAMYPFQRDTLLSTAEVLQTLQINLHTALLALQLQHTSILAKQTASLQKLEVLGTSMLANMDQYRSSISRMELTIESRTAPAQLASPSQSISLMPSTTQRNAPLSPVCRCPRQRASFYPGLNRAHRAGCPLYNCQRQAITTRRFAFGSRWLGLSVEALISIQSGTQGLGIYPGLRFHNIVPDDSPGFDLVSKRPHRDSTPEEVSQFYAVVIRSLHQLFDSGKASPFDRTEDGSTLISAATKNYSLNDLVMANVYSLSDVSRQHRYHLLRFLAVAGCPLNEAVRADSHPLTGILRWCWATDVQLLVHAVIGLGISVTDVHLGNLLWINLLKPALACYEEEFHLSDVAHAIVSESERDLKNLLVSGHVDPSAMLDRYYYDAPWVPAACLTWPNGLRIVLEGLPGIQTRDRRSLLGLAIAHNILESVKLLLDFGTPVDSTALRRCNTSEARAIVFGAFITRRKQLLELARIMLPRQTQEKLCLEDDCLPDTAASMIYDDLVSYGVFVDASLQPYDSDSCSASPRVSSVFHEQGLRASEMEFLYESGFRDIDTPDSIGYTPSMYDSLFRELEPTIQRAKWLINKGARLDLPRTAETGTTPRHFISLIIIKSMMTQAAGPSRQHRALCSHAEFLGHIFVTGHGDNCDCSCSVAGCSPLSRALRLLFSETSTFFSQRDTSELYRDILRSLIEELPPSPGIASEIIRLLTFTDLSLTHTCCRLVGYPITLSVLRLEPFDMDEASEIHEEERILLAEFESLVSELEGEYYKAEVPLWDYIHTDWCRRVIDYLEEHGETIPSHAWCILLGPCAYEYSDDDNEEADNEEEADDDQEDDEEEGDEE